MSNKELAELLEEIAKRLSVEDTPNSRFEVRAYEKAAATIGAMAEPVEDVYAKGGKEALMKLPGIGKGLAEKIGEYINDGSIAKLEELRKRYPIDMNALTRIEGLGPKTAVELYKKLGVKNVDDLKRALEQHSVRELPGFGERSEGLMLKGLQVIESSGGRLLLGDALPEAERIVALLIKSGLVERAVVAGSTRRMRETVGDLDVLATSKQAEKVMDLFASIDQVDRVIVKGPTKTTVWLKLGVSCDLRVIEPDSFGAALQYFTGSKAHNIQVRTIAVKKGYRLNEYGLFDRSGKLMSSKTEEDVYAKLGMQYVPPEMREARGEVELAQKGMIPELVELSDIKGDLHTHTKETDGVNTLEEMAQAAIDTGYSYMAVTNHTKSLKVARGMNEKQFREFFARMDDLSKKLGDRIELLKGAEVDILRDGTLDLDEKTLRGMDCVVASVHSALKINGKEMTERIVKALDSGLVHILGHPTGRVVNVREAYSVDLERVAEAAERDGVALEINAFPSRLDLNDQNIMRVSSYKINFVIDTDSHNTSHMAFMRYGVGMARRGWLTKGRILNTRGAKDLRKMLERNRA